MGSETMKILEKSLSQKPLSLSESSLSAIMPISWSLRRSLRSWISQFFDLTDLSYLGSLRSLKSWISQISHILDLSDFGSLRSWISQILNLTELRSLRSIISWLSQISHILDLSDFIYYRSWIIKTPKFPYLGLSCIYFALSISKALQCKLKQS